MDKIENGIKLEKIGSCTVCNDEIFVLEGNTGTVPTLCCDCETKKMNSDHQEHIVEMVDSFFSAVGTSVRVKGQFGIPKRYLDSNLDNFVGDVSGKVSKWLEKKNENLLIQSPKAGNGKTHLAIACMLKGVLNNREKAIELSLDKSNKNSSYGNMSVSLVLPTAQIINFSDLMLEVKASFDSKEINEQDVIKKYCGYTVLVVDDIGAEKSSDYTQAVIYSILNRRYEDMRCTIITTNLSSGDITGSYGSRILSRIASGEVITLDGVDRRLNKV